ncbi:hypothetical protein LZ24_03059 [Desulfobotulus alkaliphilus]|uniref:Uncharacterized protein n=1 Tax=Desulfobotulus alkaliphilus TaxID=622671 RepID=A0A562R7N1_9BACT|nr:hypothetical protein [Desulfobotulus alkaliphilus]TWI65067.1 hypothetical protein LZ24_03059 [Desulfobotulus alkaliphilus]
MIEAIVLASHGNQLEKMLADLGRSYGIAVLTEERSEGQESQNPLSPVDMKADGWVFFTEDPDSDAAAAIRSELRAGSGAWLSLPPDEDAVHTLAARCREWVYEKGIVCLGFTSDVEPSQFSVCCEIARALFAMCLLRTRPERLHDALKTKLPESGGSSFPDIDSVLKDLVERMTLRDKVALAHFEEGLPVLADSALAVYILGHYLWPPNPELLEDCARKEGLGENEMDETLAVTIIIACLMEKLKASHRLRLVPGGASG